MTNPSSVVAESGGRIPWNTVALLMAIAGISHFNRIGISTAANARIMSEHGISADAMGWVYSAFLISYTILMIPGGWVIDRLGARVALLIVAAGSAVFVVLTGAVGLLASGTVVVFASLLVIRGLMGIVSAPLHPSLARMVGELVPSESRARINGMVTGAALVGIAATPVVFGQMIDWVKWPWAFVAAGLATGLLALAWKLGAAPAAPSASSPPSDSGLSGWSDLLFDRSLMLLTLSYGMVGYFQYLFFYWMNYYFEKVLHLPEGRSRVYQTIPLLAMALGMWLGGWASDWCERRLGSRRGRRIVPMLGLGAGAALLGLGVVVTEPEWIVACFALAMGAVGASEGPFWSTAVELGGRRGGASGAIFNTGGNAGGILAPILTPRVGERFGWPYAVALGSLACVLGLVLWLGIRTGEREQADLA